MQQVTAYLSTKKIKILSRRQQIRINKKSKLEDIEERKETLIHSI